MSPTFIAAYDGSDASRSAVQLAVRLGRAEHADVIAVHVYPRIPPTHPPAEVPEADRELQDDVRVAGQVVLEALDVPGVAGRRLVCGSPAHTLHDLAIEHGASLIAVGLTHHKRLGRLMPGSVGAKLLHGAPCAVAAVPRGMGDARMETIGVAYDGGRESQQALIEGERLARRLGAHLILFGVHEESMFAGPALATTWDLDPAVHGAWPAGVHASREVLAEQLRAAAARVSGVEIQVVQLTGSAGPTLVDACDDGVDLLVAGSRGHGPLRSVLLGSVSRHLVDHARCPVLVVPGTTQSELDRPPEPRTTHV
jgi:nucleotide-binding universal stress UspA family protein